MRTVEHKTFSLKLDRISYSYSVDGPRRSARLFNEFSLTVGTDQVMVIMGASGAGKSTLGKLLAGILTPTTGTVEVEGRRHKSDIVYLHQNPMNSVFPWQTAYRNLDYPLSRLGYSARSRRARVEELARQFAIQNVLRSHPGSAVRRRISASRYGPMSVLETAAFDS